MLTKWLLFALIGAVGTGCVPEGEQGPFELTEEQVWKVVNRKHWGQDGIYVQATLRTFAYEIAQAYAQAEKEDLDQGQLESRLKQLVYEYASANYPAEDGTDINSIYIQYLVYVNPSFNVTNPLEKKAFDNWRDVYIRRVMDKIYDRKYPLLRPHYDDRWGLTLYSRLVFYVYLDNVESDSRPSVEDIGARTFLVDEEGNRYSPSGLGGAYPYGFDRPKKKVLENKLVYRLFFPNRRADRKTPIVTPQSRHLQLEIEGLGDEPVRRLRWDLPLVYPDMPGRRLPARAEEVPQ